MNNEDVKKMIDMHPTFEYFIKNSRAAMEFDIDKIPVVLYKEEIGVNFYFRFPFSSSSDYSRVYDFMRYAIPYLSQKLEVHRQNELYA